MSYYNYFDKTSIYNYAKQLEGKTFKDIYKQNIPVFDEHKGKFLSKEPATGYENKARKGGLGELVEEKYFHYKADSKTQADFPEAGVELKVTPYRVNKNKTISAKERLIISMINYMEIVDMDFYESNAWEKLENILLIYYKWVEGIADRLDYMIDFVYMLSPSGEDLRIIENDYYKIREKIKHGKAHELSEGDTMYLGAATKSSDSSVRTNQPLSPIMAKPRAFSLKNSYMTYVLRNYILPNKEFQTKTYKDDEELDSIVSEDEVLLQISKDKKNKTFNFEDIVINKIDKYRNIKATKLFEDFFNTPDPKSKDKYSRLAFEILGVRTHNAEEFIKANIVVKSIRVEESGNIIESLSFPHFKINDLINQTWEESDIYNFFNETKFLFVIYKKRNNEYYLTGAKFWNMSTSDIDGDLKIEWKRAQDTFIEGVQFRIKDNESAIRNNLPKKSNTKILHVRPHAQMSAYLINGIKYGNGILGRDTDTLPNGDKMTKQCFWLNNDYVLKQIKDKI